MSQPPSGIDCTGTKPKGRGEALKKGGRGGWTGGGCRISAWLSRLALSLAMPGSSHRKGGQINLLED